MDIVTSNYTPLFGMAVFVAGIFLWLEWNGRVRPMLIPRFEIKHIADQLVNEHGDRAEEFAAMEEDRAWRYSKSFEQGKWKRVRNELERRNNL
ncbi:hypothetical protein RMR10_001645 [Agrobacterium rosae]|uniref:hypothetical protein n=1 Tax=Agrobacterium rosae TaxID=1972867 RepID=UPI002A0E974D|nr:hypothetical protein [Agrobacterium rosae]MDX8314427.1 hypothetical protein [Agrobacterium rosae]